MFEECGPVVQDESTIQLCSRSRRDQEHHRPLQLFGHFGQLSICSRVGALQTKRDRDRRAGRVGPLVGESVGRCCCHTNDGHHLTGKAWMAGLGDIAASSGHHIRHDQGRGHSCPCTGVCQSCRSAVVLRALYRRRRGSPAGHRSLIPEVGERAGGPPHIVGVYRQGRDRPRRPLGSGQLCGGPLCAVFSASSLWDDRSADLACAPGTRSFSKLARIRPEVHCFSLITVVLPVLLPQCLPRRLWSA